MGHGTNISPMTPAVWMKHVHMLWQHWEQPVLQGDPTPEAPRSAPVMLLATTQQGKAPLPREVTSTSTVALTGKWTGQGSRQLLEH